MMQSIVDMPKRPRVRWFENGTYQGGTSRGFPAIHIFDEDTSVIAVFDKVKLKFVTTCQLKPKEVDKLLKTHNFGGIQNWNTVNNLPPKGIKLLDNSQIDNSNN